MAVRETGALAMSALVTTHSKATVPLGKTIENDFTTSTKDLPTVLSEPIPSYFMKPHSNLSIRIWCLWAPVIMTLDRQLGILTWAGSSGDHEGRSPRARPFHCTSVWLTTTITPNVGNSTSSFLRVGDCVRAFPCHIQRIFFLTYLFATSTSYIEGKYIIVGESCTRPSIRVGGQQVK